MLIGDFRSNFVPQHSVFNVSFLTGAGSIDFSTEKMSNPNFQQITFPHFTQLQEEYRHFFQTNLVIEPNLNDLEVQLKENRRFDFSLSSQKLSFDSVPSFTEGILPFQGMFLNPTVGWEDSDLEFLMINRLNLAPEFPIHCSVLFPDFDSEGEEVFGDFWEKPVDRLISIENQSWKVFENCIPVIVHEDIDGFLESLMIPSLEFCLKPKLNFEPLTPEWLQDLSLPNDEIFLRLHYEPGMTTTFELIETFAPINEILSQIEVHKIAEAGFTSNSIQITQIEKVFEVEPLPQCLSVNVQYFSEDDIHEFAELFPMMEVKAEVLRNGILMRMGTSLVVFGFIEQNGFDGTNLIDCCVKFDQILIVSIFPPLFTAVEKIKWRCITSLRQISSAVLPFLVR
jgi:hypothetical protein